MKRLGYIFALVLLKRRGKFSLQGGQIHDLTKRLEHITPPDCPIVANGDIPIKVLPMSRICHGNVPHDEDTLDNKGIVPKVFYTSGPWNVTCHPKIHHLF